MAEQYLTYSFNIPIPQPDLASTSLTKWPNLAPKSRQYGFPLINLPPRSTAVASRCTLLSPNWLLHHKLCSAVFRTKLHLPSDKFPWLTPKEILRCIFLEPLNLYVRSVSGTSMWNFLALMWNLDPKPSCGTFLPNLHDKPFCETFMWTFMWDFGNLNHSVEPFPATLGLVRVEPCGTWTFNSGTFMWKLGEPQLYKSGTFRWNLVEPELVTVEPLCGTLGNLNF